MLPNYSRIRLQLQLLPRIQRQRQRQPDLGIDLARISVAPAFTPYTSTSTPSATFTKNTTRMAVQMSVVQMADQSFSWQSQSFWRRPYTTTTPTASPITHGNDEDEDDPSSPFIQSSASLNVNVNVNSNAFWKALNDAVQQGNGMEAERLVNDLLSSDKETANANGNANDNDKDGVVLEPRLVSLVLEAWRRHAEFAVTSAVPNMDDSSSSSSVLERVTTAAQRSHQLLQHMKALADRGILCDPPSLEDYHAVLECWDHQQKQQQQQYYQQHQHHQHQSDIATLALELVQPLLLLSSENNNNNHNHTETAQATSYTYSLVLSILAHGGHVDLCRAFYDEALPLLDLDQQQTTALYNYQLLAHVHVHPRSSRTVRTAPNAAALLQGMIRTRRRPTQTRGATTTTTNDQANQEQGTGRPSPLPPPPPPDSTSFEHVLQCWLQHPTNHQNHNNSGNHNSGNNRKHHHDPGQQALALLEQVSSQQHNNDANNLQQQHHRQQHQPPLPPLRMTSAIYQLVISILANQGDAVQAEHILSKRWIRDYTAQFDADLKPSIEPFQTCLLAYSRSYHPDAGPRAESIVRQMQELSDSALLPDVSPTTFSYNLVLKAWMHSKRSEEASTRAMALWDDLSFGGGGVGEINNHSMASTSTVADTTTLNTVLNILAKHPTQAATMAETFLWKAYDQYLQDPLHHPSPDVISFGTVLKAYSKKKTPSSSQSSSQSSASSQSSSASASPQRRQSENVGERAETLLRKLHHLSETVGWEQCRPDITIYSSVMKCWTNNPSNPEAAAYKVEELLRQMQQEEQQQSQEQEFSLAPDAVCWNMAIQAWAQAGNGVKAEALFQEFMAKYKAAVVQNGTSSTTTTTTPIAAVPNAITFTAVLSAWAKTQRNRQAPMRAEAIFQQMKDLAEEEELSDCKPNVITYSVLMDCWAYHKSRKGAIRAEELLRDLQRKAIEENDPSLQPNIVSYNSVLKAWSLSRDTHAVSKVTELLKEVLTQYSQDGNPKLRPNANTFGNVLKALADANPHHCKDKLVRAEATVKLMDKFQIGWNSWSRQQYQRCCSLEEEEGEGKRWGQRGRGRGEGREGRNHDGSTSSTSTPNKNGSKTTIPEVPELKYS